MRKTRSAQTYAAQFPALARRRQQFIPRTHDFSLVSLGRDQDGRIVHLNEQTRLRHMRVLGTTGSGKTTFLKNMALQSIRQGRGGAIFDPHGGHPGSLLHELHAELENDGFFDTGRMHVVDLNITSHATPFNFLGLEEY